MMKRVLAIVCLVTLTSGIGDQVRHLMINDANLIETMQGYALNADLLMNSNIKTASVNGDTVTIIGTNCQRTVLSRQQLNSAVGHQSAIDQARAELLTVATGQPLSSYNAPQRSGVARFSLNDQVMSSSFQGRNMNSQSFSSNGWSMIKYDDNHIWLRKPNMPNGINRIFFANDIVTFIYNTGEIQMKPVACLQANELQLVRQVRAEIQEAQSQFQHNMDQMQQNLHNNMHNMQMRLQQNMHNMNMNMQNMFSGNQNYDPLALSRLQQQYNGNYAGASAMNQIQTPQFQMLQNSYGPAASAVAGYPGTGAYASGGLAAAGAFGNNFPFGPNGSPFGSGFPFYRG